MTKSLLDKLEEANKRAIPDSSITVLISPRHDDPHVASAPAAASDNPSHKEDFDSLLVSVVTGTKSDNQT